MGIMQDNAAVTTQAYGLRMLFDSISGTGILDRMAVSAIVEPDNPPIMADKTILT